MNTNKMFSKLISAATIVALTAALLCCLEGLASFIFVYSSVTRDPVLAERYHTEYDLLLGWINKPDSFVPDIYGPGKNITINSQRFRSSEDFAPQVSVGERWICSGDSFTFGYGVGDTDPWCAQLAKIGGIETINMGQGGYGVDQAYLWYTRDGLNIEHNLLIFAFLTEDFARMYSDKFQGYDKPVLDFRNGQLITKNVPVPKPDFIKAKLPQYINVVRSLRSMWALRKILPEKTAPPLNADSDMGMIIHALLADLRHKSAASGRTVVTVYLPEEDDYNPNNSDELRIFIKEMSAANNWHHLDLIDDFRTITDMNIIKSMFIQEDIPGLLASAGHYTEKGHTYIANTLLKRIREDSRIAPTSSIRPLFR